MPADLPPTAVFFSLGPIASLPFAYNDDPMLGASDVLLGYEVAGTLTFPRKEQFASLRFASSSSFDLDIHQVYVQEAGVMYGARVGPPAFKLGLAAGPSVSRLKRLDAASLPPGCVLGVVCRGA
jgi:hypothetical protein